MKKLFFFSVCLILYAAAFGQHEYDKWVFGNNLGLDFSSGSPVVFNTTINAWDNAASISDENGNLLFYSEGTRIYDRNGNVMPNGSGIMGDTSGGQPATIVRKPGNSTLYYVFTCPNFGGANGLRYTIVDMSLNGGMGDVDTATKNILFYSPTAEKLVPIVHANGYDIWILAHEWNTNTFRAYLLTANGFVPNHVSSTIGSIHGGNVNNAIGQLTVTKAGNRVACCLFQDGKIELFDFNRQSGVLTNAKSISGYYGVLGVEFSPDGSKLYATNYLGPNLTQFNLSNYTQTAIAASATTVGTIPLGWAYYGGYLALGPDDKIYVTESFSNKIGCINVPNALGAACNYNGNAISLGTKKNDAGLVDKIAVTPINYSMSVDAGSVQTICNNSYVIFDPVVSGGVPPFSYAWTATGNALSCSNCLHPSVTVTQNSSYIVTVTDVNGKTASDTIDFTMSGTTSALQLTLVKPNSIDCTHPVDTTYAQVTNGTEPVNFHWGDGATQIGTLTELHMYSQVGIYVISVTDSLGCINSAFDTVVNTGINISIDHVAQPICVGDTSGVVVLNVTGGVQPYSYEWSDGSTTAQLDTVPAGSYSVTVSDVNSCTAIFDYNLNPANDAWGYYVYLTATDANCGNTGAVLADVQNGVPPYTYLWNTGDTTQNIANLPGGDYSVVVSDSSGCRRNGHIEVETYCASIISGIVFADTNQNCILDSGEVLLSSVYLAAVGNGHHYFGSTNADGEYSIIVPDTGAYAIEAYTSFSAACSNLTMCNNPSHVVTISNLGDSSVNNNFVSASQPGFDLTIHPGWTAANPGFQKEYWVMPYNKSYVPFNGQATVTLVYDSLLIYQYSLAPMPTHDPATHTLTWVVDSLPSPFWDWVNMRLRSYFQVPVGLSLGQELHSVFTITPTAGDCDSTNNIYISDEIVTGSLDPNEKDVEPADNIAPEDSVLHYTIHFQNCGTDSTHFIIVKDTLSPYLDPLSVQNEASSHPYSEFTVSGSGILTWTFNPLRLVDSLTNPRGSQGFVSFKVEKRKNLPIGSVISNSASIYFDYNEPVKTNIVSDTVAPKCTNTNVQITSNAQLFCSGDSAEICAPAGFNSYSWSTGGNSSCIQVHAAGNYYVTVTDNGNCSAESNHIAIGIYPATNVSIASSGDTIFCYNGINYQWYYNNALIPSATGNFYVATQTGNYSVQVTDSNGCRAASNVVLITVGVDELQSLYAQVYPNPSNDGKWTLVADKLLVGESFTVTDNNGRLIYKSIITGTSTAVNLQLASGVYFLRINSKAGNKTFKIVKL